MSFAQQLNLIAYGRLDAATVAAVAERLTALDAHLGDAERATLTRLAGGVTPAAVAAGLRSALDPARQLREAQRINELEDATSPTPVQLAEAIEYLLLTATAPIASSPDLRVKLVEIDRREA